MRARGSKTILASWLPALPGPVEKESQEVGKPGRRDEIFVLPRARKAGRCKPAAAKTILASRLRALPGPVEKESQEVGRRDEILCCRGLAKPIDASPRQQNNPGF